MLLVVPVKALILRHREVVLPVAGDAFGGREVRKHVGQNLAPKSICSLGLGLTLPGPLAETYLSA